jgi:DNA-binding transcriptional LysR family regulator
MELRHLRYFVAVAQTLHFGRAAQRMHVAQPALSRQIRDLELEMGLRLFERDRRHVALAPAGAVFLRGALLLLESLDRAIDAAKRSARGELGTLRVTYIPTAVFSRLPEIVRAFRQRLPGVEVRMHETPPAQQVEALLNGRADIGFARGPVHEPALEVELVAEEALVAALPSGHRLGSLKTLKLEMLAREPFVLQARSRGPGFHDEVLAICRRAGFSPRVVQEGSQIDTINLVAAGIGVAIVPNSTRALRRAGVTYRPLSERPTAQLVMIWRGKSVSPLLREFLQAVRGNCTESRSRAQRGLASRSRNPT